MHLLSDPKTANITKRIFISRKLQEDSPFLKLRALPGIEIIDEPLITTLQIRYSYAPQTKWIFFSSKNAIRYFFAQDPQLPADVKHGVMSQESANYLLAFGKTADFIGEGVDTLQIAKDFRDVLKDDSVLFPQAIDSLQTVQKQLAFTNTCYNLYVYKTTLKTGFHIPYADTLIFTSPSNVTAYFTKYKINPQQTVIAMGNATKYKLSQFGISNVLTPAAFNENGLFEVVNGGQTTNTVI